MYNFAHQFEMQDYSVKITEYFLKGYIYIKL